MVVDARIIPNARQPKSRRDQISEVITEAIFSGRLRPGERIVEVNLARELGIGTTSLREALFELEGQGYVVRLPNKGVFVRELSIEQVEQIYRVRLELEGLAVELCTGRLTRAQVDELQRFVDTMKAGARDADFAGFHQSDLQFHRCLWEFSGNYYVASCLEGLVAPLFVFHVARLQPSREELLRSARHHQDIVDALTTLEPLAARRLAQELLELFAQDTVARARAANPGGVIADTDEP